MVPLADVFNHKAAVVHLGEGSALLTGAWLSALVPVCTPASHHLPSLLCSVFSGCRPCHLDTAGPLHPDCMMHLTADGGYELEPACLEGQGHGSQQGDSDSDSDESAPVAVHLSAVPAQAGSVQARPATGKQHPEGATQQAGSGGAQQHSRRAPSIEQRRGPGPRTRAHKRQREEPGPLQEVGSPAAAAAPLAEDAGSAAASQGGKKGCTAGRGHQEGRTSHGAAGNRAESCSSAEVSRQGESATAASEAHDGATHLAPGCAAVESQCASPQPAQQVASHQAATQPQQSRAAARRVHPMVLQEAPVLSGSSQDEDSSGDEAGARPQPEQRLVTRGAMLEVGPVTLSVGVDMVQQSCVLADQSASQRSDAGGACGLSATRHWWIPGHAALFCSS